MRDSDAPRSLGVNSAPPVALMNKAAKVEEEEA